MDTGYEIILLLSLVWIGYTHFKLNRIIKNNYEGSIFNDYELDDLDGLDDFDLDDDDPLTNEDLEEDIFSNEDYINYNKSKYVPKYGDRNTLEACKLLELSASYSKAELKTAYRKAAKIYHPDNKDTGNAAKFRGINTAFKTLEKPNV